MSTGCPRHSVTRCGSRSDKATARRPDGLFVALAVLTLLSDAASAGPLVCVIDDAHWLDHSTAEVLSFVARRLHAESVVLLFVESDEDASDELSSLPELELRPLGEADAVALLTSATVARLDDRVRDRIVAESRGNPLALLELPGDLTDANVFGASSLSDATVAARIEATFLARVKELPVETCRLAARAGTSSWPRVSKSPSEAQPSATTSSSATSRANGRGPIRGTSRGA